MTRPEDSHFDFPSWGSSEESLKNSEIPRLKNRSSNDIGFSSQWNLETGDWQMTATDEELMVAFCATRDKTVFAELMSRTQEMVHRVLSKYGEDTADDLTQE